MEDLFQVGIITGTHGLKGEVKVFPTTDDKERFLKYYLNNVGIRKAAKFMNCSPSLLIKWLREFINNLKLDLDKAKSKLYENKSYKNKLNKKITS